MCLVLPQSLGAFPSRVKARAQALAASRECNITKIEWEKTNSKNESHPNQQQRTLAASDECVLLATGVSVTWYNRRPAPRCMHAGVSQLVTAYAMSCVMVCANCGPIHYAATSTWSKPQCPGDTNCAQQLHRLTCKLPGVHVCAHA